MTELKSLLSPNQGTTVRVITAVDQDKGRPRGIGYTIVSGKPKSVRCLMFDGKEPLLVTLAQRTVDYLEWNLRLASRDGPC